jgi:hypothetical protein
MRKAICSVSCHELTMVFPSARDFEKTYLTRALKQPLPRYHPPGSAHHLRPARVPRGMGRSQPGAEGGGAQAPGDSLRLPAVRPARRQFPAASEES